MQINAKRKIAATAVIVISSLVAVVGAASSCQLVQHPTVTDKRVPSQFHSWAEVLDTPAVVEHDHTISGRWAVPLSGLLNLEHPNAVAAGFKDEPTDIVLPVHVITHPLHGAFVIDTGVPRKLDVDGVLVNAYLEDLEVVVGIEDIIKKAEEESGKPLRGVFLTHLHLDHVLGLAVIDRDTPVYSGPGETVPESMENALTRGTYQALFDGRPAIREWDFASGQKMGPIDKAVDIFGDGSVWALSTPGHTSGSTSYLAMTTSGPKIFTGDTSHTRWGWDHGVEPGSFTADQAANATSLRKLKELASLLPNTEVFVGHVEETFDVE